MRKEENKMDRLTKFEAMLDEIMTTAAKEKQQMDALKLAGKEKSATYRQLMANRLMYTQMIELYKQYRLVEE